MEFRQPRNIKSVFVATLNSIFKTNTEWVNNEIEVVELAGDNSPEAFEQYPWDSEDYPRVIVFGGASIDDHWAIDSRVGEVNDRIIHGTEARESVTLTSLGQGFEIQVPGDQAKLVLRSVELWVKTSGLYEEAISVEIYRTSGGTHPLPTSLLTSGSIKGEKYYKPTRIYTGFYPHISLQAGASYFLVVRAAGSYLLMVDPSTELTVPRNHVVESPTDTWNYSSLSGSFVGQINGLTFRRLGGGTDSSIRIFVESKDLSTVQKIADLVYVYMHLVKHSNPGRKAKTNDPNQTGTLYDFVSDMTDKGIYIKSVSKGPENVRTRGNDRIWSVDVTVEVYSHWTEDFKMSELEDIDEDINTH